MRIFTSVLPKKNENIVILTGKIIRNQNEKRVGGIVFEMRDKILVFRSFLENG